MSFTMSRDRPPSDSSGSVSDEKYDPLPTYPKTYKLLAASLRTRNDVEPEDYLAAIAEMLFLTICMSFCITYLWDKTMLDDNPIKNMVGYNNPCAFWDQPPALYFASFMFCPMVYFAIRYAVLDTVRAKMTKHVKSYTNGVIVINCMYAASQCIVMGIFVITPHKAGGPHNASIDDMHWHMRAHSACFLQFVPVLCITLTSNYIEGYISGNPKSMPSKKAWAALAFYIVATTLETVFASYAIFFYEGDYAKKGRDQFHKVNPYFMMTVDYCWFFSLPFAAAFQPSAPNLLFKYELEQEVATIDMEDQESSEQVPLSTGQDDEDADGGAGCGKCCVAFLCCFAHILPILCIFFAMFSDWMPFTISPAVLFAVGIGVPIVCCCILMAPVARGLDPNPFPSGFTGFTINDASFGLKNYMLRLLEFAKAAAVGDFRPSYAEWFTDNTEDDSTVGVNFGGNTKMFYSWAECQNKLSDIGNKVMAGTLKRESELALVVLNNLMWPEAGKFALGFDNDDHAFVRPYLAEMFDNSYGKSWSLESLRAEFAHQFSQLESLEHDLVTRNLYDIVDPSKSKTIVTQMVLQILHRVSLGMDITDIEAEELAALQTTQLLPASCPLRVASTCLVWNCIGKPARATSAAWIKKYKTMIRKKWPGDHWTERRLNLLASAFLDAMLQAGGRSVPLAIDLVMGYMLSANRPACLDGVDFTRDSNIRSLLMEAMRFHPPVTVLPTWVQGSDERDPAAWQHELICLDRALADPEVFPDPDKFQLNRTYAESGSMAWGDFALVNNDRAHPHSHACPGKELSINMVIAFVQEYQAAGPWDVASDDIKFNYYGTKGFKMSKGH